MTEKKLELKLKEKEILVEQINDLMIEFEADNLKDKNKSAMRRNRKRTYCLTKLFADYKNLTLEISKLLPKRKPTNQNWKNNPIFKKK
jgi:methanogenic corrinoid protein MtbC1